MRKILFIFFILLFFNSNNSYADLSIASTNDYANINSALGLTGLPVSLYVRTIETNSSPSEEFALTLTFSGDSDEYIQIAQTSPGFQADYRKDSGTPSTTNWALLTGSSTMAVGNTHCVVFTIDNGDQKLYIDGPSTDDTDTETLNEWPAINQTTIGARLDSSPSYGEIQVIEAAVWDVELTATEAASLCPSDVNTGGVRYIPLQVRSSNLMAYWTLDDHQGGTTIGGDSYRDLSGNGYNMTGTDAGSDSQNIANKILAYP